MTTISRDLLDQIEEQAELSKIAAESAMAGEERRRNRVEEDLAEARKSRMKMLEAQVNRRVEGAKRAFDEMERQAEVAGQPVNLETPFRPGQIPQPGGPMAPPAEVPLEQVSRGGGGGVTGQLMEQLLGGMPATQEEVVQTQTAIPRKVWWGSKMTPVTTTQRRLRPTGMTQAQAVNAVMQMAQESRLSKAYEMAVGKEMMSQAARGAAAGLSDESAMRLGTQGYASLSKEDRGRILDYERGKQAMEDLTWEADYRYRMAQAKAQGKSEKIAQLKEDRAARQELRDISREKRDRMMEQKESDRRWLDTIRPWVMGQAKAGLLGDTSIKLSHLYGEFEQPASAEQERLSQHRMANAARYLRTSGLSVDEMEPMEVYTGLAVPAARRNQVVVRATKPGKVWGRNEAGFGLAEPDRVFADMYVVTRKAKGATQEQIDAASSRLKAWGLVKSVKEDTDAQERPMGTWTMYPVEEGGMAIISSKMITAFQRKLDLAKSTGLPFASASAGAIEQNVRRMEGAQANPEVQRMIQRHLEDIFSRIQPR